jgi:hypothetical protein
VEYKEVLEFFEWMTMVVNRAPPSEGGERQYMLRAVPTVTAVSTTPFPKLN